MADEGPAAKRSRLEEDNSAGEEKEGLLSTLSKVAESLESAVQRGERDRRVAGDVENYINLENPRGIKLMFQPMPVYAESMIRHKVKTWKEFEGIISKHYKDDGVKELVEKLLSAEENYRDFILEQEEDLAVVETENSFSEILTVGKTIPKDLMILEAQSGDSKPLNSYCKNAKYTLFILMRHYG